MVFDYREKYQLYFSNFNNANKEIQQINCENVGRMVSFLKNNLKSYEKLI